MKVKGHDALDAQCPRRWCWSPGNYQHRGAVWGKWGRQGASYGIPTKATPWRSLQLHEVGVHVAEFLTHAAEHHFDTFNVTPIGCGRAGFAPEQIAPMFAGAPANVILPPEFLAVLEEIDG